MLIDQDRGEQQKQKSVYIYEEQYGKQSLTKTQDDGTQIWYSQPSTDKAADYECGYKLPSSVYLAQSVSH